MFGIAVEQGKNDYNRFVSDSQIFRDAQTPAKAHQYKVFGFFGGIIRRFVGGKDARSAEFRPRPDFAFLRSSPYEPTN